MLRSTWRNSETIRISGCLAVSLWFASGGGAQGAPVTATALDCSPLTGSVTLNEVNTKANPDYVELYFLSDTTLAANSWYLWIDMSRQATLPAGSYTAGDYLLLDVSLNPSNQEVMLVSSNVEQLASGDGVVVDYLGYGGASNFHPAWSVPSGCGTVYMDHDANQEVIDRLPDGTGDWADHVDIATPGASNDGSSASCVSGTLSVQAQPYALACPDTRAAVSLSALCIDGSVNNDYTGTVGLSLDQSSAAVYATSSGGNPISQLVFDGTEGGILTFYVEDDDEHITIITASDGSNSGTDSIDFRAYGFRLSSVPDLSACSQHLATLTAYGQNDGADGCSIIEGFSGNRTLKAWFDYLQPSTNNYGTSLILTDVDGDQSLPTIQPGVGNIALDFINGVASVPLSYADAGQLQANFRYDQAPYDGSEFGAMLASSNPFTLSPAGFGLRAYTSPADVDLDNVADSGVPHWPAGRDFRLQVRAECADGTVLPNYQPATAEMWLEMVLPAAMHVGDLSLKGSRYPSSYVEPLSWVNISGLFSNGMINDTGYADATARFSEVGIFRLHIRDTSYLGGTVPEKTLTVGRFTPAYLQVTASQDGQMQPACNGSYSYTGEVMHYALAPSLTITARNALGVTTGNYSGSFMKLTDSAGGTVTFTAPTRDGTQLGQDAATPTELSASLLSGLSNLQDNGDGTLVYALSALDSFSYRRNGNALIGPYTSDIDLVLSSIADGDGIRDDGSPVVLSPIGSEIRYGRLVLDDAYGPQTDDLTMRVRVEYFDGSDFIDNPDDYCTLIASVGLSNWQGSLSSGETGVSSTSGLLAGSGEIVLSAPGVGTDVDTNEGSVDLTLGLSTAIPAQRWLLNDENGDGVYAEDPTGTASFGMYRGDDRFLYWRETQ